MGAENPIRRKQTARELAERFGRSPRTIRMIMAEPRSEYETRAKERQSEALAMHDSGLSYAEIGRRLGITRGAASGLVRRARQRPREELPGQTAIAV